MREGEGGKGYKLNKKKNKVLLSFLNWNDSY